ncbi:MAG: twin arginine-targeting protein translocase, TatA/E family [Sphingobacteriales bacterium]|nr:twin arginine-targeting protein translocase, TatA/E family [Sphingobacteriales bacterium]
MYNSIFLFLNMGTPEIMIIMFAVLLLFGGKKIPELARGLGKGIREFKDASEGVKREIHNSINNVTDNMDVETSVKSAEVSNPPYSGDVSSPESPKTEH